MPAIHSDSTILHLFYWHVRGGAAQAYCCRVLFQDTGIANTSRILGGGWSNLSPTNSPVANNRVVSSGDKALQFWNGQSHRRFWTYGHEGQNKQEPFQLKHWNNIQALGSFLVNTSTFSPGLRLKAFNVSVTFFCSLFSCTDWECFASIKQWVLPDFYFFWRRQLIIVDVQVMQLSAHFLNVTFPWFYRRGIHSDLL